MKFYLFSFILESAVVRSEMEVVLRCEDYVQVDALTVVDFTMLYVRVSSLVINSLFSYSHNELITKNETRDNYNKRRVTPTV